MSRIFFDQSQRLSNVLAEFGKYRQSVGQVYRVYKFRKCGTGITRLTTQGERDFNKYSTNRTSQFINIYNGKAPIVVVWNNSTTLSTYDENMKIKKETTIGDYYYMFGNNNFTVSMQNDNLNLLGKYYVTQYISKTLILESRDWQPDNDDIVDYIYMVIDSRSQSYQWLELTNYEPTYNEETKEYQYGIFTFETINTKYATTGKTLLDFIQLGSQGEGYAFPMEIKNKEGEIEVVLDPNVNDYYTLGTKYLQIDFMSGVALSSIFVYGREKITNPNDVQPTKILLPHKMLYPSMSPFFFNTPVGNFFRADNVQPTKKGIWKSYKENYKGNDRIGEYNILNKKEVLCGLELNKFIAEQSNPIVNGKYSYNIWEERNIYEVERSWFYIGFSLNPWFIFNWGDTETSFSTTLCDWLSINNMYNTPYDVFNYEYEEVTKYKLTDTVGIMGGIVNAFIGGLDIGWTSTVSKGLSLPMNLLIPCNSFNDGFLALNDSAPLPMDVFIQDKESHVLPVSTNIMSSFKFSLTDRYQDRYNTKPLQPEGRGGNGIWDTKYLGQTKYEDGTLIHANGEPLKISVNNFKSLPPLKENEEKGWIIDGLGYYAVGITDTRITAYDTDDNNSYEAYFETNSKARGDVRIWKNFIKFNCYENFNTVGKLVWPFDVVIPTPEGGEYVVEEMIGQNITKPLSRCKWFGYCSTNYQLSKSRSVPNWSWNKIASPFDYWYSKNNWEFYCPTNGKQMNVGLSINGNAKRSSSNFYYYNNTSIPYCDVPTSKVTEYYAKQQEMVQVDFNDNIRFDNDKFTRDLEFYENLELTLDYNNFPNATKKVLIPIPFEGETNYIDLDIKFDIFDYGLNTTVLNDKKILRPFGNIKQEPSGFKGSLLSELKILEKPISIGLYRFENKLTFIAPKTFDIRRYIFTKESEKIIPTNDWFFEIGITQEYIIGTDLVSFIDVEISNNDPWCVTLNNENEQPFGPTITNAILVPKK